MSDNVPMFGKLEDVAVRDAWPHEARKLTPWLAENIDRIADVIGIPLELEATEVLVENFKADIIATDPSNERRVLIENQLEPSDHTHLGQIMTYLAGLNVSVVIWIAPSFREPHLSAIRWLNQHTVEPFAFFALQLRVVRIGNSPLAPLFDVVERPNDWDRRIQEKALTSSPRSEIVQKRRKFWEHMLERIPSEGANYGPDAASSRWRSVDPFPIVIAQFLAKGEVGVFIRTPRRGGDIQEVIDLVAPVRDRLEQRLGSTIKEGGWHILVRSLKIDTNDRANWDRMADWLHEEADRYEAVLRELLPKPVATATPSEEA